MIKQNFKHIYSSGEHGCSQGNLRLFSLGDMVVPWGNLGSFLFKANHVPKESI
jgi:hypothetical protein